MTTVLVSAPYMIPVIDRFRPLLESYSIELFIAPVQERLNEPDLLALAGTFDGALCGDDRYTERVLNACTPRLKVISKWGTGIDSIDQQACDRLGIRIGRTLNAFTLPVADTIFGYMLAFVRRQPWMDRAMKDGIWDKVHKREVSEIPTSAAMLIADRILGATGKHSLPPTLAAIKVPQVVTSENRLDRILVNVDGQPAGATETITDVGQLAVQQYQAVYPYVLARAVARRAVKKAAVYAVKDQVEGVNGLAGLGLDAAGVVWEALESADTRCWALLPREIQVLRVELPAGNHQIQITPDLSSGRQLAGPAGSVEIDNGRNTYLLACFPGPRAVGQVLQRTQYKASGGRTVWRKMESVA